MYNNGIITAIIANVIIWKQIVDANIHAHRATAEKYNL